MGAEIVGIDDFMTAICWTCYFVAVQGYNVKDNCLHQDNNISIILEKNGKAYSRKSTKHINIRYSFITERFTNGEVSVVWCPTGDMIGEYMTKTLQGAMFRKSRQQIIEVIPDTDTVPVNFKVEQLLKA